MLYRGNYEIWEKPDEILFLVVIITENQPQSFIRAEFADICKAQTSSNYSSLLMPSYGFLCLRNNLQLRKLSQAWLPPKSVANSVTSQFPRNKVKNIQCRHCHHDMTLLAYLVGLIKLEYISWFLSTSCFKCTMQSLSSLSKSI